MKRLAMYLTALVLGMTTALAVGVAFAGATHVPTVAHVTELGSVEVPLTDVEIGVASPATLWAVNHAEQKKWTLNYNGLQSESLVRERMGGCSMGHAHTLID